VLAKTVNQTYEPDATNEGSVFKINMLVHRLPKLKDNSHAATAAFRGTFHIDEGYEQMMASYRQASQGHCRTNRQARSTVTPSLTIASFRPNYAPRAFTP
jgi:phytoene dehydrogenase-like protein